MAARDDELISKDEFLKNCSAAGARFFGKVLAKAHARGFEIEIRQPSFSLRAKLPGRKRPVGFFQGYSGQKGSANTVLIDLGCIGRYSLQFQQRLRQELHKFAVIEDKDKPLPRIVVNEETYEDAFLVFLFLVERIDDRRA
jgi:hypothetical protein